MRGKERLIINNHTDLPMDIVLVRASRIVGEGRISGNGESYCYATRFKDGVSCYAKRNKTSDTLTFLKEEGGD